MKRSRIPLVKVRWNSKRGPEFTWEREDQFKKKYPHLFTKTTPSSSAASEPKSKVASDDLRDALSVIFGLSELKLIPLLPILLFTLRHDLGVFHLRSLRGGARTVVEQHDVLRVLHDPLELEDHVMCAFLEHKHPEDLVPVLSTEREDDDRLRDGQHEGQLPAVRAEIEVLRRERLAYEQESMETRQALARSEAYCRALEARVTVLETEVRRHEWQRQAADDFAVRHIMRTQALEAGARVDTLEDTGSSS
ncbi:hypothetical protein Tco_0995659 [Tanacetum coccineum]